MQIIVDLNNDEKLEFEFRTYEYQGMQISVDIFLRSDREYNKEHYDRLINTLLEKYQLLQECLYKILGNHGYKDIKFKSYDFKVLENQLIVY